MELAAGFENGVGGDPFKATSWRGAQAFPKLEPFSLSQFFLVSVLGSRMPSDGIRLKAAALGPGMPESWCPV